MVRITIQADTPAALVELLQKLAPADSMTDVSAEGSYSQITADDDDDEDDTPDEFSKHPIGFDITSHQ